MTRAVITDPLPSWSAGVARQRVVEFVQEVTDVTSERYVPAPERVAVFDNDGTLWCEKPMPVQADFLLRRVGEMAAGDPALRGKQPWKAVAEHDYHWLSGAITKHYNGDDSDLQEMSAGVLQAYAGSTIEDFEAAAAQFMGTARHPTSGRPYAACIYQPMRELLDFLDANGFTSYIASGGGRDFMRPFTHAVYGVPPERVIGSTVALEYDGERKTIVHKPALDVFDDGPEKALRIWSRVGRRPILAGGNSNGDIEMLEFTSGSQAALDLLVLHDDAINEYSYTAGAEKAIDRATRQGWTIVSIKNDWQTVFPSEEAAEPEH